VILRGVVASIGGVIVDGVGAVVRGDLCIIGQAVVIVLNVVVAILLDGLGAVPNFVRKLRGGPEFLRGRRVSFVWSVGTLCCSHSRWYSPRARMAEEESPAPHRTRGANEGAGMSPPAGTRRHAGPSAHSSAPPGRRISIHFPPMSAVARYLVGLCDVRRAGNRSWVWLLLERSWGGKVGRRSHIPERGGDVRRLIFGGMERSRQT